uniref:Putative secreted protein n=1 Tax=Anopheles triannulatus TaxID=58253 RepID=A0A2M4B1S1_9DIPT
MCVLCRVGVGAAVVAPCTAIVYTRTEQQPVRSQRRITNLLLHDLLMPRANVIQCTEPRLDRSSGRTGTSF